MFSKKITWIGLVILSILFSYGAYKIFPKAFPILNVKLEISKDEVLIKATELSKIFKLGPENFSQAATFSTEQDVQNFIELDQGGSDKLNEVIKNNYYSLYTWGVRHYEPGNINEAWFYFDPSGEPYGFDEKLSEDLFIESLSQDSALDLAELYANGNWNIDFTKFSLIEKTQKTKPSKRIDHTFVYKRNDIALGEEGEYRITLVVSGNKLTKLKHSIKVPEYFTNTYKEMRSENNFIGTICSFIFIILYFFIAVIGGLFVLNRQRWLIWKTGIYWAIFISILMFLVQMNFLPLSWLTYETAESSQTFVIKQILMALAFSIVSISYLTLSFVGAESLTRKAFPHQIQFWKLWTGDNASSLQVIGRTIGGYLLIGLDLIFVVLFYTVTANYFGWWMPSGPLFDPDMIATPFPWIASIGMSLHAGFWEECLFRAVPLACAGIIGQRYGNKKLWIAFALVFQAVIFAGAHATYPSYPAYSRLVELIIPSIFWGIIYLKFGLLPVIISHFGYDVVWFSLPLFVSTSPDLFFDRLMVILLALVPILAIIKSLLKTGKLTSLNYIFYNASFKPSESVDVVEEIVEESPILEYKQSSNILLYILAGLSCVCFYFFPSFEESNLKLKITRNEAIDKSNQYLFDNNITLDESWDRLTVISQGSIGQDDQFIWENEGRQVYEKLLGSYIDNAIWKIRYVKFSGEDSERAEEYSVIINHDGSLNQIHHKMPENMEGKRLIDTEARLIAQNHLYNTFGLTLDDINELEIIPSNKTNRDDWEFIYSDKLTQPLNEGDLRIKITISGDKITSTNRYVHISEEWKQNYKNTDSTLEMVKGVSGFFLILIFIYAAATSIAQWSKGLFNFKIFKLSLFILLPIGLINIVNNYPLNIGGFDPITPFMKQLVGGVAGSLIGLSIVSVFSSSILGNISNKLNNSYYTFKNYHILLIAIAIIGINHLLVATPGQFLPVWVSNIHYENTFFPILSPLLTATHDFLESIIILIFIIQFFNRLSDYGRKKHYIYIIGILLISLFSRANDLGGVNGDSILLWLVTGLFLGVFNIILYKKIFVYDITIIPLLQAIIISAGLIATAFSQGYPSILIGNFLAVFVLLCVGIYFKNYLFKSIN